VEINTRLWGGKGRNGGGGGGGIFFEQRGSRGLLIRERKRNILRSRKNERGEGSGVGVSGVLEHPDELGESG